MPTKNGRPISCEHGFDLVLGPAPDVAVHALELGVSRVVLGQPHAVVGQSQRAQHVLGQLHGRLEFLADLVVSAEQVGIVLGEAADAGHAGELARLLVAVNRAELGQPQRADRDNSAAGPRKSGCGADSSSA